MKRLLILAGILGSMSCRSMAQSCAITCPQNIIVMADSSKEGAIVNLPKSTLVGECGQVTYTPASGTFFRLGPHTVSVVTASGQKCQFTVTVVDNESPKLTPIALSVRKLWPATNRMKKVAVYYEAWDNSEEVNSTLTVDSNDPDHAASSYQVLDNHTVKLRASRLPSGEPRIYFLTVTSTDAAGNKTKRTTSIAVSETMEAIPLVSTK